jgi:hypothetical protein
VCCGQKRASLTPENVNQTTVRNNSMATSAPGAARPAKNLTHRASVAQMPAGWSSVGLRYLEKSPIRVRGPATGRQYEFSAVNSIQAVDARDAESLLNTRFFAKTG